MDSFDNGPAFSENCRRACASGKRERGSEDRGVSAAQEAGGRCVMGGAMGIERRRAIRLRGALEVLAVLFLALPVLVLVLWWGAPPQGNWRTTNGVIVKSSIGRTHYNAPDHLVKADVTYEYSVGVSTYQGRWRGAWPEAESPNALPPSRLHELTPGRSLLILYDPDDPRRSSPHYPGQARLLFALLFPLSLIAAGFYLFKVFPILRRVL